MRLVPQPIIAHMPEAVWANAVFNAVGKFASHAPRELQSKFIAACRASPLYGAQLFTCVWWSDDATKISSSDDAVTMFAVDQSGVKLLSATYEVQAEVLYAHVTRFGASPTMVTLTAVETPKGSARVPVVVWVRRRDVACVRALELTPWQRVRWSMQRRCSPPGAGPRAASEPHRLTRPQSTSSPAKVRRCAATQARAARLTLPTGTGAEAYALIDTVRDARSERMHGRGTDAHPAASTRACTTTARGAATAASSPSRDAGAVRGAARAERESRASSALPAWASMDEGREPRPSRVELPGAAYERRRERLEWM